MQSPGRTVNTVRPSLCSLRFSGALRFGRGRGFKTVRANTNRALPNGNALFVGLVDKNATYIC